MNTNELKKLVYLNKPSATFQYIRKGAAHYKSVVGNNVIIYCVPFGKMEGDADFLPEMEGKLLAGFVDEGLSHTEVSESNRGCCSECGEGLDNEVEWKYNTECELCGTPIPEDKIIKKV